MKSKKWLILLASLGVILLSSSIGATRSSFVDLESSTGNDFQAWTSTQLVQTTEQDFDSGVLDKVHVLETGEPAYVELSTTSHWYDTDWSYRKKITIDCTKIEATLTDFPVLIHIDDSESDFWDHCSSETEIVFTESDGTSKVEREVEKFDHRNDDLFAWVKIDRLSGINDTEMYIYYGNDSGSEANDDDAWNSSFEGVWHLDETSGTHYDATAHSNDGTPNGGVTQDAVGQINGADEFAGDDDWVDCGEGSGSLDFGTGDFTLEAWVKTTQTNTRYILSKFHPNAIPFVGYVLQINNGKLCAILADEDMHNLGDGSQTINDNSWHYLAVAFDRDEDATYYVDGTNDRTVDISSYTGNTNNNIVANLARKPALMGSGDYFGGIVDEVRFSNVARSGKWIKTCYNNQNSPSTFYSMGDEEGFCVSSGTIASQILDTAITGARWDALCWDETLESGTAISFAVRASNTEFLKDASRPFWMLVRETSPITSRLPSGRYIQWRATLTTSDTPKTPTLHEVRVYYSDL